MLPACYICTFHNMFDYIQGKVVSRHPTYVVLETGGIGYLLNITLHGYDQIAENGQEKIYTWLQVQEDTIDCGDSRILPKERYFCTLFQYSGIGPNTARLVLSGMTPEECRSAILTDNELAFRQVKGVGPKTAKRVILELKDKILKSGGDALLSRAGSQRNLAIQEALSALITLGFAKNQSEKALSQIVKEDGGNFPLNL